MFETELTKSGKGIKKISDREYNFTFCVHSLLTTYQTEENLMMLEEYKALENTSKIEYRNKEGKIITVNCNFVQINTGVNGVQRIFQWLPNFLIKTAHFFAKFKLDFVHF